MFKHRLDQPLDRKVVYQWCLLSFNGGCINAGGFLATGRFVSHVTGFATLFGVDAVDKEMASALGLLAVPCFFLAGSFLAGLLIDRPIYQGRKPHFDYVMGLSALFLSLSVVGGEFAIFGIFGGRFGQPSDYVLLSLLCLACGLQNGAITSSSGGTIRTTHLTGLTTDLGLGLARLLNYSTLDQRFSKRIENQLAAHQLDRIFCRGLCGRRLVLCEIELPRFFLFPPPSLSMPCIRATAFTI